MNFPYGPTQFLGQYDFQFQYPSYPQYSQHPQYPQQYPYYYYPQVPLPPIPNAFFHNPVNIQPCQLPQINFSSYQPHHNSSLENRKVEQIPFAQQGIPHASFEIKSAESKQAEEPKHLGRSARKRLGKKKKQEAIDLLTFADRGCADGVKTALGQGVDPNFKDARHQTALHHAAIKNSSAVIKTLVNYEKIDKHVHNVDGKTPLACAIEMGNDAAVVALVINIDDANYLDRGSLSPLDHVFKRNSKKFSEFSKSIKIAKILLKKGADLKNCDFFKSEKSMHAIKAVYRILNAAGIASSVINFHFPKNAERFDLSLLPKPAQTALTESTNHYEESVDIKLAEERYFQELENGGQKKQISFFHRNISQGNSNIVIQWINRFKLLVNALNGSGCAALHVAVFHNQLSVVEELLKVENVDKHIPTIEGETPLYFSIITGNLNLVRMLASNPDDANYTDRHGLTPLDYTFKLNSCSFLTNIKIVMLLVEKGAKLEKCSYFNPNFTKTEGFQDKEAVKEILHEASIDKPTIDLLFKNLKS